MQVAERDFIKVVSNGKLTTHSNPFDEINVANMGLRVVGVDHLSKMLHWEMPVIANAIGTTTRTLERYRKDKKPLSKNVSENALELARLSTHGIEYFGSVERWNEWLNTPNIQFNSNPPKSVINSIRGRELIKRIINGLAHGFWQCLID